MPGIWHGDKERSVKLVLAFLLESAINVKKSSDSLPQEETYKASCKVSIL